ncbi:YdjY domain-containing protein [Frigoriglobus tundricola]|uniref:Uncharacterized protein n=1 Tax=Frigoriglobus tundricola TaxID=2774151 RepID=A0A6M5Z2H3_9BACT|nr:YdjY domain-containing protein [Frigoriglobus tundricola]QJW99723.1 hypothetical protein FTUN_7346 [Frigoriglobus tundricola]
MKLTILGSAAAIAFTAMLVGSRPETTTAAPPGSVLVPETTTALSTKTVHAPEPPKPEDLPEFPLLSPKNKSVPLTPDKKSIIAEVAGEGKDSKVIRVGIMCEVCLREGPLEQFLCKKGTKEHEAIVRVDLDAELIHLAITAAGGKPGTPTGFIDPKTEQAKYTPATGSKVNVLVHYKKDGKLHTHAAQEWIWDSKKKAPIAHGWVFAGSVFIKDPGDPNAKPYYGANSGDIFSISNFPYSTLEMPVQISKDDAQLTYEAKTDRIPPLTSKVWVLIDVPAEKK